MDASGDVVIAPGFLPAQTSQAVDLVWEAFAGKLGAVLRPETKAKACLARALDPRFALAATAGTTLVGVAGFKGATGGFIGGTQRDFRAVYGQFGGVWRALLLSTLERAPEPGTFLMDGVCVSRNWRGRGVGIALLGAIIAAARTDAATRVQLDVIDTNPRAAQLYRSFGFHEAGTHSVGMLRHVFGFRHARRMVYPPT
ncbi:MAG: GNAT family N-acetyltransferase [Pseudomonadota bacterium]